MIDNLLDIAPDTPVYRIFRLKHFEPMVTANENVLVKPSLWDDPFENIVMRSNAKLASGETASLAPLREKLFGQCWFLTEESDAMWRIYSDHTDRSEEGVKVRCTAGNLLQSLWEATSGTKELCCFLGRVDYVPETDIVNLLQSPDHMQGMILDSTGKGHAQSLLFKRQPFDHENEARLIFSANNGVDHSNPLHRYSLKWNNLIEEIVLDPRLAHDVADSRTKELLSLGFSCKVFRSNLYVPRQLTVDLGL